MRRFLAYMLAFAASVLLSIGRADAQDEIDVVGTVLRQSNGGPLAGVEILTFSNVKRADDIYKEINDNYNKGDGSHASITQRQYVDDDTGKYSVSVAPNGAIIFFSPFYEPIKVYVKGRKKIDIKIKDTDELPESISIGKAITVKDPVLEDEMVVGNQYSKKMIYYFNKDMLGEVQGIGMTNARMVAQVYVIQPSSKDTLQYQKPLVMHGEQFHKTQALWNKDPLYELASESEFLTHNQDSILFDVRFEVPDKQVYHCKANIWVEDYIKTYYQDTCFILSTARVRRPFQFLQYTFDECRLNDSEHFRKPHKEEVATDKNMKLQFKVGEAQLDMSDSVTVATLDSLKTEFSRICDEIVKDLALGRKSSTSLDDIGFEGYSSPEGTYSKNVSLSNARTQSVRKEVFSVIPKYVRERLNNDKCKGIVHGWDEVANILERDSLRAEAAEVRGIIAASPDNMDRQWSAIRKLKYYDTLIKERLKDLRQVKCNYKVSVERALFPEEILDNYVNKDRKKNLTLNEYWHLFRLIKDEKELETLYRDAYNRSKSLEKLPWALAANNLAISYLKREKVDTTILEPLLQYGKKVDYYISDMRNAQIRYHYNYPEIMANQAQMFMLAGEYRRAIILTTQLKKHDSKYALLDAVCRLMGRIKLDVENKEQIYKLIEESSPQNKVVMRLYQKQYDSAAVAIKALPQDSPLTDYFKVQCLCGKSNGVAQMQFKPFNRDEDASLVMPGDTVVYDVDLARIEEIDKEISIKDSEMSDYAAMNLTDLIPGILMEKEKLLAEKVKVEKGEPRHIKSQCNTYQAAYQYLKRCFQKDKSYIDIARGDLDIDEELLNDVLGIKTAKKN